jgi:hypothetical protein
MTDTQAWIVVVELGIIALAFVLSLIARLLR